MLASISFIFITELRLLFRRLQEVVYPLSFFIIIVSLFPLAFTPDPAFLQQYVPGFIWLAALLVSLLSIESIFLMDKEEGYLEQLLLSPLPLAFLILVKLMARWLATELPLIIFTALLSCLFHLPSFTTVILCLSLLVGTPIFLLTGSLMVALTLGLRHQGVLLGLLMLPLVTPVLIFGVNIVQQAQAGLSVAGPLAFLSGLSLLAITFLPPVIAATLRVSVDN